jgi:hypothetical protein
MKPAELLDFMHGVVTYILKRGKSLPDGDTIGRTATEKFRVRHKPSMFDRGTVLRLSLG